MWPSTAERPHHLKFASARKGLEGGSMDRPYVPSVS
jgi:hypothetical protein